MSPHETTARAEGPRFKLPETRIAILGFDGHTLLLFGLVVCALGLLFGLVIYTQLKNLPVHESMREVSELIYATSNRRHLVPEYMEENLATKYVFETFFVD